MIEESAATILLVEDNEDDVFVMQRALKLAQIGNPLQRVRDGQQALDYLIGSGKFANRSEHPLPFIVFLDLKLPYVNGFEILSWLRRQPRLASIAVIVLTSSAEDRDHERAYALGARSYLVKPPTSQALTEVFESLKSYWLSLGHSLPVCF